MTSPQQMDTTILDLWRRKGLQSLCTLRIYGKGFLYSLLRRHKQLCISVLCVFIQIIVLGIKEREGEGEPACSCKTNCWDHIGSVGMDVHSVPPTRLSVTELARGRMGPLQSHTAGSNNTYSTAQTVSQNNFIVPKIGVESGWKQSRGLVRGSGRGGGAWEGREKWRMQSPRGRFK